MLEEFDRMRVLADDARKIVGIGLSPVLARCLESESAEIAFHELTAVVETRTAEILRNLTKEHTDLTGEQYAQVHVWVRDDTLMNCRAAFIRRFGFAVLTEEAIATIKQHVGTDLLLEVGAWSSTS